MKKQLSKCTCGTISNNIFSNPAAFRRWAFTEGDIIRIRYDNCAEDFQIYQKCANNRETTVLDVRFLFKLASAKYSEKRPNFHYKHLEADLTVFLNEIERGKITYDLSNTDDDEREEDF